MKLRGFIIIWITNNNPYYNSLKHPLCRKNVAQSAILVINFKRLANSFRFAFRPVGSLSKRKGTIHLNLSIVIHCVEPRAAPLQQDFRNNKIVSIPAIHKGNEAQRVCQIFFLEGKAVRVAGNQQLCADPSKLRAPVFTKMIGKVRVMRKRDAVLNPFGRIPFQPFQPIQFLLAVGFKIDQSAVFIMIVRLVFAGIQHNRGDRAITEGEIQLIRVRGK